MDYQRSARLGRLANWFSIGLVIGGILVWGMSPAHAEQGRIVTVVKSVIQRIHGSLEAQSQAIPSPVMSYNPNPKRKDNETTDCNHADDLQLLRVGVLHHTYLRPGRQDCDLHDLLHRE